MRIAMLMTMIVLTSVPYAARAAEASASPAASAPSAASSGTVLITGASRGLGFEFARQYAAAGWTVIATARKPADSAALRDLAKQYPSVRVEALDVVDGDSVAALVARLAGAPIDVLINNAGDTDQFRGQFFPKLAHDRFVYLMELNAHGAIRVSEALFPNVLASRQRKILAVSSLAGSFGAKGGGMPGGYWYKASKAALNMVMFSLAQDVKGKGVAVACLSPGQVDTQGYAARGIKMPGLTEITVSVGGMRQVIDGLTLEQTGTFIRFNGEQQPW